MAAPASPAVRLQQPDQRTDQSAAPQARLRAARAAQKVWSQVPIKDRLAVLREFRHLLAANAGGLASIGSGRHARSEADTLSAEVLPLAEAVRFLEQQATRILTPAQVSNRSRPLWLRGVHLQVQRDAWGVVLVIGPSNYPLFLPGVQTMQALAAGNAVVWKPGCGGSAVAQASVDLLGRAGLPPDLVSVTDESAEAAQGVLRAGVDKVVMTGSEAAGRAVLRTAADHLTPVTVELSGCDAMFVLADADLSRSVDALLFGLRLNGSATCIAPRRVFLEQCIADAFKKELAGKLTTVPAVRISRGLSELVEALLRDALDQGAVLLRGGTSHDSGFTPLVLDRANPQMRVMRTDVFAPVIGLCSFKSVAEALRLADECPYALGATVFGGTASATAFARQVSAGVVVVNDAIVPTADPRMAFGGRHSSGFGKSRGTEGLLEMTVSKTIAVQTARRLRHLEPPHPRSFEIFSGFLAAAHGRGWGFRLHSILGLVKALRRESESES